MHDFCAAARELIAIAGQPRVGEPVKVWLPRAADVLGIPYGRAWLLWQQRLRMTPEFLRWLHDKNEELLAAQADKAAREAAELTAILERLDRLVGEITEECQDGGQR